MADHAAPCADLRVLQEAHENLTGQFQRHEEKQNGSMDKIWTELKALREMYSGRPTWAVALTITTLVGLVVGLATRIIGG